MLLESKVIANSLLFLPLITAISLLNIDAFIFQIYLNLIVIDFSLGIVKSIRFGSFSIAVLKAGILTKIIIIVFPLILGLILVVSGFINSMDGFTTGLIKLLAINEGISAVYSCVAIIDNVNYPNPSLLRKITKKIRDKIENLFKIFGG
ncbi:MAG: phage holin family protein [Arcobacter sp.]|uniref:phage holin family protein n=1 Tax=Arcobacter sp. TaxID=1872629 RepID=UPI003C796351